jgi:hypothetical protein
MKSKSQVAHTLLAAWLQEHHPELFAELARRAGVSGAPGFAGFTDILQSIGSSIGSAASTLSSGLSSAVQSVGSFLKTDAGQGLLTTVAAAKLQSSQNKAIQTQISRAQAGLAPAPISSTWDASTGTYVPALATPGGAYAISPQMYASLAPSFFDRYGLWIAGGSAALVLVFMLSRRGAANG